VQKAGPPHVGPIRNETPNTALGDRGTESRVRCQIPHTETKPYTRNAAVACRFERGSHVSRWRLDWLAEVVGFELRNVAAKYASERSHRFPLIEPNSGHRDNSRLRRCAECQMLARASVNRETVIWQFIRQNRLSNRVFKSFGDIVDHYCCAWNRLIDRLWENHVPRAPRLGCRKTGRRSPSSGSGQPRSGSA